MNTFANLGTLLVEEITNEPGICFYPARFKTPHKGHWEAVRDLCLRNYITKVVVLISPKEVDGITQEDSYVIWKTMLKADPNAKIYVEKSKDESPIKDIYGYLKKHPLDKAVYLAYNEGEDDDPGYVESLQKTFGDKVHGIAVNDKAGDITSPRVRDMLAAGDYDGYVKSLPDAVRNKGFADDVFKVVAPHTKETLKEAWTQPLSYQDKLDTFVQYVAERLELEEVPTMQYLRTVDFTQKQHSFGGYMPDSNSIMVVVANRNMADIMRSIAHELVHAKQNQLGMLDMSSGETGSDIENQANSVAGVIMRMYGQEFPKIYLDWVSAEV